MPADEVKLDKDMAAKLQAYQKAVAKTAEGVIFNILPAKILELQALIDSTTMPTSPFHISHAAESTDVTVYAAPADSPTSNEPEAKKRKLSPNANGSRPSEKAGDVSARYTELLLANKHVHDVQEMIKRECEQLIDNCDKIKLWVNLSMPRIEDGDNFGVQVQEEVLNELHRSQESGYNLRDGARQHYLQRAKIASKRIKYPHVEDYEYALREHDEKQLYLARSHLHDLRTIYAVIGDILHKNIAKLRAPKGNNSGAMY